jgi:hypothetical protein
MDLLLLPALEQHADTAAATEMPEALPRGPPVRRNVALDTQSSSSSHGAHADQNDDDSNESADAIPELYDLSERDQVSRRTFSRSFSMDVADLDLSLLLIIG